MSELTGHCLCEAISYQISSKPKVTGYCYCKSCQIKSGSDRLVYLACAINTVWIRGPVKWYESMGDSGEPKQHGFCSECGSTLFGKPQHWSHLLIVYAGSLDNSSEILPKKNLWLQDAPSWSCVNHKLESYDQNPS